MPSRYSTDIKSSSLSMPSAREDRRDRADSFSARPLPSPKEIELQYLIPNQFGTKLRNGHPPVLLTTHYFAKSPKVIQGIISRLGISDGYRDTDALSSARVRECIVSSGKSLFYLEFKGPKECSSLGRLSRPEISLEISKKLFFALVPGATSGTVVKLRYAIPGYSYSSQGVRMPITLQLDEVLKAGAPATNLRRPLYRADIELTCESFAHDIRAGRTTFSDVLHQSVELSALDKEAVKDLSYTTIASHGVSRDIYRRCEELLSLRTSDTELRPLE